MDFRSDEARQYFLDNVVGKDGYASTAGHATLSASLEDLRVKTAKRIAARKGPSAP